MKSRKFTLNRLSLSFLFTFSLMVITLPALADTNKSLRAHEKSSGLLNMPSARTQGKGFFSIGMHGFALQRQYTVLEGSTLRVPEDNSVVIGMPISIGLTDYLDVSAGVSLFHDARPLKNQSDLYKYHTSPSSGVGATQLGFKVRLPVSSENLFQMALKAGANVNTSSEQIDGMLYNRTRKKGVDVDASLLETVDLGEYVSLHFEQGYVSSGSDIYDDQLVFGAGLFVNPTANWSFGVELANRTFIGVSPQTAVRSLYYPQDYWDGSQNLGNPAFLKDEALDYSKDYFLAIPSVTYAVSESIALYAGAAYNIADQMGREETFTITAGISFNGLLGFDSDADGVKNKNDKEPNTPKGYPVDSFGIALDSDGDSVPDGRDDQIKTPRGAKVDSRGIGLDSDSDGVYDGLDNEPDTPSGFEVDSSGVMIFIDSDSDGVHDSIDNEPGTPRGIDVDEQGVTLDNDGDGVPNSLDNEPDSQTGKPVDKFGVTIAPRRETMVASPKAYSIHVSSHRAEENAAREINLFNTKGYAGFSVLSNIPEKGIWYRVFIGRFSTEEEARTEAENMKRLGITKYTNVMKVE